MPIASLSDFKQASEGGDGGGKADGSKMPPFGPGGIYHEKQVGSLCAVHAMNNLLQGPLFDQWQLYEVADQLDKEERRLMGGTDIDLTGNSRADGFFNVQVIRVLLERMGYAMDLVKAEAGKSPIKNVGQENGFICNKREHWFAIRRVGAEWFDLNSCLRTPQHYTNADVHHHINEAMREGYAVFAVRGNYPRTALEDDDKALLEAVQGCGRPGQGHTLFGGRGHSLSASDVPSSVAPGAAPAASGGSLSAEEMRAKRLARLGGGAAPAPAAPVAPTDAATTTPAPAAAAAVAPAAAPPAAAAPAVDPALQQLLDMGFDKDKAQAALKAAGGNAETAVAMLL